MQTVSAPIKETRKEEWLHGLQPDVKARKRMQEVLRGKIKSFDKMRKTWLDDPQVKKEYDSMEEEFQIAMEIAHARLHAGVTQAELARKVGTKSTAISRLESPNYGKASLSMLRKIAGALDCKLQVRLVLAFNSSFEDLLRKVILKEYVPIFIFC